MFSETIVSIANSPLTGLLNFICTWYMIGLIWFVQIVHYPLHADVPEETFQTYQEKHVSYTSYVVVVPMLVEAITAVILVLYPPIPGTRFLWILALVLEVIIFLSTYTLQTPKHFSLLKERDPEKIDALVKTNWIRTISWSGRGIIWIYFILHNSRIYF